MSANATVKLLVIEDDLDDRKLITDFLEESKRANFITDFVGNAEEAKELIRRRRFDCILLDYRLPDLTGLGLMQWFRDNHFRLPVVLVTSHGDTRLQNEALEAGVCEYREKGTFNAEILERTLLYAVGLHNKQTTEGGVGVGLLIQELVGLTRDSVAAQTKAATEMTELRSDLKEDMEVLRGDMREMKQHGDEQVASILKEMKKGPWEKVKGAVEWSVANPIPALVIVLLVIVIATLTVLLINSLDVEQVKALKGLKKGASLMLLKDPNYELA